MDACHLCDNACINPELTSDNDLSYFTIGKCGPGFRIFFGSGDARPTEITFEVLEAGVWHLAGYYRPRFCPNCGRRLIENEKKEEDTP